jgi:hypothetical protein
MGSLRSLQGKNRLQGDFLEVLCAKRNKLLEARVWRPPDPESPCADLRRMKK